jgi:3-demethoxyubiquinol 3-hydroxylase
MLLHQKAAAYAKKPHLFIDLAVGFVASPQHCTNLVHIGNLIEKKHRSKIKSQRAFEFSLTDCPIMQELILKTADSALRTLFAPAPARRPCPGVPMADTGTTLDAEERKEAGALMRVNHVGEVCAQALYMAQAFGARAFSGNESLARHMEEAAQEETDHLAWTQARLEALGSRPSLLNPIWYAGAFGMGLLAAKMGTRASLGFVVETERQVEAHLNEHLARLPVADTASRAVVEQMRDDEARHARQAQDAGAMEVPTPVRLAMKHIAKLMTTVAHRI